MFSSVVVRMFQAVVCIECRAVCECESHTARHTIHSHTLHGTLYTVTNCTAHNTQSHTAWHSIHSHTLYGTQYTPQLETLFTTTLLNI